MAAPTAFATKEQMAERSDGFIPADRPYLATALAAASTEIRKHCRWHIAEPRTETIRPSRDLYRAGVLYLPTTNLTAVGALTSAGYPVDVTALEWYDDGSVHLAGLAWPVTITITHGFELDEVPDLTDLTLQIASRALGAPLGQVREQSLTSQIQWSQTAAGVAGGTVLMQHEQIGLSGYRIGYLP